MRGQENVKPFRKHGTMKKQEKMINRHKWAGPMCVSRARVYRRRSVASIRQGLQEQGVHHFILLLQL